MAIAFARAEYVQRSKGQSSVSAAAYQSRTQLYDERLGKKTHRWDDDGTLIHHEIRLPAASAREFYAEGVLWNTGELAERRKDAVVAKRVVTPLPLGLTREESIAISRSFADEQWVSRGLGVQIDIHDDGRNPHTHHLITQRRIEGATLSRLKVRDTEIRMSGGRPRVTAATDHGEAWAAHQEAFFKLRGKPIAVDPVAPYPGRHLGPKRFRPPNDPRAAEASKRQEINAQVARDPQAAAESLSGQGRYDAAGMERFFARHVVDPVERRAVQAEALPKLAAMQRNAIFLASHADLMSSQAPKTVEYVARGMASDMSIPKPVREAAVALDRALTKLAGLRQEDQEAVHVLGQAKGWEEAGASRVKRREEIMPAARKVIHKVLGVSDSLVKRFGDAELNRGAVQKRRGENTSRKWKIQHKRIADQLVAAQAEAAKQLELVRPHAQRKLEHLQQIGRNARAELEIIQKADNVLRQSNRQRRSLHAKP